MRLLDSRTLALVEFPDTVPPYAILSHTWGTDEVDFKDIQCLDVARRKRGFPKIQGACDLAASHGFHYVWIDTCCIDKSSSAELSEAINSMYRWYKESAICYAFLSDVTDYGVSSLVDAGAESFRKPCLDSLESVVHSGIRSGLQGILRSNFSVVGESLEMSKETARPGSGSTYAMSDAESSQAGELISYSEVKRVLPSVRAWLGMAEDEDGSDIAEEILHLGAKSRLWSFLFEFMGSRWFTRGWTLQELIAPNEVKFYSKDWSYLGRKSRLRIWISAFTGIDHFILAGADISLVSVARKMFWAARRQTTRVEDMAYSLLGLFSVNMPLIYGEGDKAFIRLQEELIKTTDDQSIFAWTIPKPRGKEGKVFYGLLAESPRAFLQTGQKVATFPNQSIGRRPTMITSQGIQAEFLLHVACEDKDDALVQLLAYESDDGPIHNAALDCQYGEQAGTWPVIKLWPTNHHAEFLDAAHMPFTRIVPWEIETKVLDGLESAMRYDRALRQFQGFNLYKRFLGNIRRALTPSIWNFHYITVSPKAQTAHMAPLGFWIQIEDGVLDVVAGYPSHRWEANHNILTRGFLSPHRGEVRAENLKGSRGHCTRVLEGFVALQPTTKLANTQPTFYVLVLGFDHWILPASTVPYRRLPWCRLVEMETLDNLEEQQYESDWSETSYSDLSRPDGITLQAHILRRMTTSGVWRNGQNLYHS
ncbi:hypothetical protein ACJ41O_009322 [Fusarium nematophilum]